MDTREQVGATISGLCESLWTLSALVVSLERGVLAALPGTAADLARRTGSEEGLVVRTLEVLAAIGLVQATEAGWEASPGLAATPLELLRADLRSTLGVTQRLMASARTGESMIGWSDADPVVVRAQAAVSEAITVGFARGFLPQLEGLIDRLRRPGAAVLDVGAGAAGFCVAMAREFPELKVVGLEPGPLAIVEGRAAVEAAGLTERIELRPIGVEALTDVAAFDCVYVAQMFMSTEALTQGLPRVHASMRAGGWLVTGAVSPAGAGLGEAIRRLRNTVWGGDARTGEDVVALLKAAGFADARIVPGPSGGPMLPVAARRGE